MVVAGDGRCIRGDNDGESNIRVWKLPWWSQWRIRLGWYKRWSHVHGVGNAGDAGDGFGGGFQDDYHYVLPEHNNVNDEGEKK